MIKPTTIFSLATLAVVGGALGAENEKEKIDFERDVRPILEFNCVRCHDATEAKGGLRFDTAKEFFKGGDGGPALVKGEPDESYMLDLVNLPEDDIDVMPSEGRTLHDREIATLRKWIAQGAPWPESFELVAKDEADFEDAVPLPDNGKKLAKLEVFPRDINLETQRDSQSVVAMATFEDDTTLDVTENARFEFADPSLVDLKTRSHFKPAKNGKTKLTVKVADETVSVPVQVGEAQVDPPISFHLDVMPVFMREGCNVGSCHGSARGQDGFMLSLFGYDPEGDHYRLTREMAGHRINLALPEESLIVQKATEEVPHTGGKLIEKGGPNYQTLVQWIDSGAKMGDPEKVPEVTELEVNPPKLVLEGSGATQQLTVRAKYSDGHDRDVTDLAVFISNNEPVANVSDNGLVKAGKRGEAFVMARFNTKTVGIQTLVIPEGLEYTRPEMTENNYIDGYVHDKLHKLRIVPSGLCTDEVFLRRVYLDIVGKLPSADKFRDFVNDDDPDKRSKLIDELLNRKEFTEMWVMKWSELLQIRSSRNINRGISYKAALLYNQWLSEKIASNVPFDEIVKKLIASEGGTFSNPATNFYQVERDTLKLAENVAQVFMGMRLQCAQCHNHPFDRWTMNDYYSWAAFFAQIGRKEGVDPREQIVYDRGGGNVRHKVDNRPMDPKFLGGKKPDVEGKDRRRVLAEWMASPDNPYFARNIVNIVWSHFFGIGIIDPVDDVRVSNPASNPELLSALAERFQGDYDYDFKQLVRDICNSATYQRTTQATPSNENDRNNFAKARVRRQRAEVMLDTITQVTETENKFKGLPRGARAVQIADGRTTNYFLTTFGRATRETVCSCEVKMDPSLSQALHLMNGPTVTNKIKEGDVVKEMLGQGKSPKEIVEEIYIRSFTRKPSQEEMKQLMSQVKAAGDKPEQKRMVLNDIFWAVLNSKEFMFNH